MPTGGHTRHIRWLPWFIGSILGAAALGLVWVVPATRSRSPGEFDPTRTDEPSGNNAQRQQNPGLIVEGLAPESPAAMAGLRVGDRIVTCDGEPVLSPAGLKSVMDNAVGADDLVIQIQRDGEPQNLVVPRKGIVIDTRPDLTQEALQRYEDGRREERAGNSESTAQAWTNAAELAGRAGDGLAAAWLHMRAAQAFESRQRWSDASQSYQAALDRWNPGTDDASRSRALVARAKCLQQQADADSARQHLEEARRLDAAGNRRIWEGVDLHSLGMLTWSRGDLDSARRFFGDAVTLRERWMPDSAHLGESLNGMGAVAYQEGDLDLAEDYYRRSLEVCERALPDSLAVADGLNNLGVVAVARGDLDAAFDYNARSLAIRERVAPDSEAVTSALTNMGIVEYKRGHLQAAQEYYGRSLAIHERLGSDSMYVARDFINLGVIAYERGDLDAAQDYYLRGLSILERLAPDSADAMASVYNLGMVAGDRGDWDLAQRNLSRALAFRERTAPNSLLVAESCNSLGNLAYAQSDLETAAAHYVRALEIEERLAPESLLVSGSLHNLGGVALQRGQLEESASYYKRALVIRERLAPGSLDLASSLHGLGDVALRQGRAQDAVPLLIQAIETIEAQRDHIHAIQTRALLLARFSEPYVTLQNAYLALGDQPSAFHTTERARARSLLDGLSEARADIREGVDLTLLARERAIQESLTATDQERQTLRDGGATEAQLAANERVLNELLVEYEDIQGQIRRASPRYAALTQPQPLSLTEIQSDILDADTVLLEYALGLERSLLWLVTSDGLHSFPLPAREEVDRAARRVHELVTARNQGAKGETVQQAAQRIEQSDQDYRFAVSELSEMVLGPVADRLGTKRLLIVADGALQYVPFGALPVPVGEKAAAAETPASPGGADRPPLIVDHEVISLPSASVLGVLRREVTGREPASKSVAVLADPVLVPEDPRVKRGEQDGDSGPPDSTTNEPREKDRKRGVGRIEPAAMQRLRFTRLEAESILALTADQGLAALDFAASKRTALSPELSQYRIVHLATHGLLDSQHPELSGIVLSLVDERGIAQDGFLRLHEIYNLRLNADLVVLSACQTALGREVRGEGLVGLTRGFMYAGAARVVASLWSVQDKATAELMQAFYEAMLRDHQTPAAALRTAQVRMWKEGRAPYYWAAFVLQGEYK